MKKAPRVNFKHSEAQAGYFHPLSAGRRIELDKPATKTGGWGRRGGDSLRIISKHKLREFWERHPDSKNPLLDWYNVTHKASWQNLAEARESFRHADLVGNCTVFNIKGNNYRLITAIKYRVRRVYTLHVLTHKEYDEERWKNDCYC